MQKYHPNTLGEMEEREDGWWYHDVDVDAALAAKDQRIAELEDNEDAYERILGPYSYQAIAEDLAAKDARIAELCQRLDQVHLMAATPAPFSHSKAILGEIADLTIGYGPAESQKVVE